MATTGRLHGSGSRARKRSSPLSGLDRPPADLESDYDYSRDMFAQRQFVRFNGWYMKPSVTGIPIIWGRTGTVHPMTRSTWTTGFIPFI